MRTMWGISWSDNKKGRGLGALLCALLTISLMGPAAMQETARTTEEFVSVIVREISGAGSAPERAVHAVGGDVELELGIINGFSARVPRSSIHSLKMNPGILSVTPNYPVKMMDLLSDTTTETTDSTTETIDATTTDSTTTDSTTDSTTTETTDTSTSDSTTTDSSTTESGTTDSGTTDSGTTESTDTTTTGSTTTTSDPNTTEDGYLDPNEDGVQRGTMYELAKATHVRHYWRAGFTGQGVDVAVIDTGVSPVEGVNAPGKVVMGPDLSFEAGAPNLYSYDTNGHGTHMAGIIAGRDTGADPNRIDDEISFMGIAPGARIVPVKVANAAGATDVSQVLAAMHWVVQHRNSNGLNIKVLNLSFGTDGTQDYRTDPLTYAVEVAWRKGITVVVAAGNQQFGSTALNNPAYDPYVIAVGANDTKGTYDVADDVVPSWSARGDGIRNPDLVAPGRSVISLRVPNSFIDSNYGSTGRYGTRYFKGSGTSQASAVVSGAAALIHSQRPGITPDQVKGLLKATAKPLPAADAQAQGSGMIDLKTALRADTPNYVQNHPLATGTGSLEASRGSLHVLDPQGNMLSGEYDIFGTAWSGSGWSTDMWNGSGWSGGSWNGSGWSGNGWSGSGWSGSGWSGSGWSGSGWSGSGWSGNGWSGSGWS